AGPEVGANLEIVALAAMQSRHSFLPDGVKPGQRLLGFGNGLVVHVLNELVSSLPRILRGLPDDDVQTNTEANLVSGRIGVAPDFGDLFRNLCRWLAPSQINIHLARCKLNCGFG